MYCKIGKVNVIDQPIGNIITIAISVQSYSPRRLFRLRVSRKMLDNTRCLNAYIKSWINTFTLKVDLKSFAMVNRLKNCPSN